MDAVGLAVGEHHRNHIVPVEGDKRQTGACSLTITMRSLVLRPYKIFAAMYLPALAEGRSLKRDVNSGVVSAGVAGVAVDPVVEPGAQGTAGRLVGLVVSHCGMIS